MSQTHRVNDGSRESKAEEGRKRGGGGEKKERSKRRGQDEELRGRSIDADFVEINEYLALIQCKQRRRRVRMKRYIYTRCSPPSRWFRDAIRKGYI